jgi:stage II sporulation protein D
MFLRDVDVGASDVIILRSNLEAFMRQVAFFPVLIVLSLCAACGSCDRLGSTGLPAPKFGPTEGVPTIRVALRKNVESVELAIEGPYKVENGETSKILLQGASLSHGKVTFDSSRFSLSPIKTSHIVITPKNDGAIVVGNSHYRGILHLWGDGSSLAVVNHVNIEHYLASVVPAEMKISWPEPALQAQAVAARTYALWRMSRAALKQNLKYDLTSGSDSQVYAGLDKESDKSRRIIVDTAGTVLMFKGEDDDGLKIFPTYYHSTCGGNTSDADFIFGGDPMECLTGVPCGNCRDSPVYEWSFTLDQEELSEIIESLIKKYGGKNTGKVTSIVRIDPDYSERSKKVLLKGAKGELQVSTAAFRRAVGTRRMKSSSFKIEKTGDSFKITGYGWGHGVGMCQWGAHGMADPALGYTAEEILKHYYQKTELQRIY